jgi:uncharacterized protein
MLSVSGSPPWRTVTGGSRRYVERAAKRLDEIRLSTPVRAVRRYPEHAEVRDADGQAHRFDAVVIATHPDQALRLLDPPTDAERDVLGAFTYTHMNRLQNVVGREDYIVTLGGPVASGDPGRVIDRMEYAHPAYTPASVAAQRRLPGLNTHVTAFAGAYHGWGFHEDGCRSGAAAARALGGAW